MIESTNHLPQQLQLARKARRISQLDLSLRLGVSQRHVSFVESGRAKPSRDLLVAWLRELEPPMVVFNQVMIEAGFAPVYGAKPLSDPGMQQANHAIQAILDSHDPMPAFVIDEDWNLLRFNRGARWLAVTLMPWVESLIDSTPSNLLDLLAHPEGFTKNMLNLNEVGPTALGHLRHEAAARPGLATKVQAFEDLLKSRLGGKGLSTVWSKPTAPLLTTRYATPVGELAFFSMFTTFGTPHDITLASLRIEHMFAADEATRELIEGQVG
ncbi:helix-turn-helix transcriptional regulator [bacterium]|nr:helix-turn-helix transcriptional regulator [bacterium]